MKNTLRFILKYFLLIATIAISLIAGYLLTKYCYFEVYSTETMHYLLKLFVNGYVELYFSLWVFLLIYLLFLRRKYNYGILSEIMNIGTLIAIFALTFYVLIIDPNTRMQYVPKHNEPLHILFALPLPFLLIKTPLKTFMSHIIICILILSGVFYFYYQNVGIFHIADLLWFYFGIIPAYMIFLGFTFYRMKSFSDSMFKKIDNMKF